MRITRALRIVPGFARFAAFCTLCLALGIGFGKNVCIYNETTYGLGTEYRLDSIIGVNTSGYAAYRRIYTYDAANNPIYDYSKTSTSATDSFSNSAESRIRYSPGMLTYTRVGSIYTGKSQSREYLGAGFRVDSTASSDDSGMTFITRTRIHRTGDTVYNRLDTALGGIGQKKIFFPAGDSILVYQITFTGSLNYSTTCRPDGDTCRCPGSSSPYKYVVENGLLRMLQSGSTPHHYFWRQLAPAAIRVDGGPKSGPSSAAKTPGRAIYNLNGRQVPAKSGKARQALVPGNKPDGDKARKF